MRVAYLVSLYPAVSHTFIQREVQALRALGVEVDTFSIRTPEAHEVLSQADRDERASTTFLLADRRGIVRSVARLGLQHPGALTRAARSSLRGADTPGRIVRALAYVAEAALLLTHLRTRGITHVHAHFANNGADVARLVCMLAADGPAPVTWSWTMHGPTELFEVRGHDLARKTADASFVACISDFARSQLMALVDEHVWPNLHVVHCGIVPSAWSGPVDRPLAEDGLHVLCVGRLVPVKAQLLLVQAVGSLTAAGVAVRLTLVGDGPGRPTLERHLADAGLQDVVTLTGSVGQDEIRDWYAWAHVFALVSFAEGVPVVLMEAMASGLPVVATRIAGVQELVEHGVNGLVLAPGRVDAVQGALNSLLDAGERARLARSGRETVLTHFEQGEQALRLQALFTGLTR